jgi:tetratricopeptide (TPR) repeat protein
MVSSPRSCLRSRQPSNRTRYCHERGRTVESDVFSGVAQRLCEELKKFYPLPPDDQQPYLPTERDIDNIFAEIQHNRGVMANEINRPNESLEYLLKFNTMMMKELGHGRPGTDMRLALSFNELGCAYMVRDDYPHAEECFEKSISSMEKLDNYERWQVSLPGVNLGVVYWLTGRYNKALDVLLQGLRDREKKFGFNDRESFM